MSKPGKFASHPLKYAKNHPIEVALGAATAGFGGAGLAGMGPLAGMLATGAAPAVAEAGAAIPGASGLAELAGATGAPLASTPSVGTGILGGDFSSFLGKAKGKGVSNLAMKQGANLLFGGQPQGPPGGGMQPPPMQPIKDTVVNPPMAGGGSGGLMGMAGIPPEVMSDPRKLQAWLQQQGGMA